MQLRAMLNHSRDAEKLQWDPWETLSEVIPSPPELQTQVLEENREVKQKNMNTSDKGGLLTKQVNSALPVSAILLFMATPLPFFC